MEKNFPPCPVEITLRLLENKWRILIIRDLLSGTKRFGELKKSVCGISQRSLTLNLRSMEESGLIKRKIYAEVPPRVEYSLSETGITLIPVLDSMKEWGENYKKRIIQEP